MIIKGFGSFEVANHHKNTNLKAIHNSGIIGSSFPGVANHHKNTNLKAIHNAEVFVPNDMALRIITKIQI